MGCQRMHKEGRKWECKDVFFILSLYLPWHEEVKKLVSSNEKGHFIFMVIILGILTKGRVPRKRSCE